MEATQVPINRWMDKEDVVYIYIYIYATLYNGPWPVSWVSGEVDGDFSLCWLWINVASTSARTATTGSGGSDPSF